MIQSSGMRVGDAEREDAVALLGEHLAAGRLGYDEFQHRMDAAMAARTQGDLDAVFDDLPGRRPGRPQAATAGAPIAMVGTPTSTALVRHGAWSWAVGAVVAFLVLAFAPGLLWWLLFMPFVMPVAMVGGRGMGPMGPRHGAHFR